MATSDLHGNLEGLDPKGADVVVLAGDIAPLRGRGRKTTRAAAQLERDMIYYAHGRELQRPEEEDKSH